MSPILPAHASLRRMNQEATQLLHELRRGSISAMERFYLFASPDDTPHPRLSDAQHMIARKYGYASWPKLKEHVDELARECDPYDELVGL